MHNQVNHMKRRNFIQLSALATGGFMLSFSTQALPLAPDLSDEPQIDDVSLGSFLKIAPDGSVLFQLTKHEMGQGVFTGLAMILAEELCADWNKVSVEIVDADLKKYQNPAHGGLGTGGSTTVPDMYTILRRAGATARDLLIRAAAEQWKVKPQDCYAAQHAVVNRTTNERLDYGVLAGSAATLPIPGDVVLKPEKEFTLIGKPTVGKSILSIVTGKQRYGLDVKVEGMLYAVVARCPVYRGKLRSFDASLALRIAGVKKVVTTQSVAGIKGHFRYDIREGVAVVADSFYAARKGCDALRIEWSEGKHAANGLEDFERMAAQKAAVRTDPTGFVGDDNAMADLGKVRRILRASYVYPYQHHSFMEPLNCTAHHKGDAIELWTGTQAPHFMIREVAQHFKISEDQIRLHSFPSGGGFGRRWYPDAALEAICISKEAGNIPVKLVWTREDDHQTSFAHCYVRSNYQAGLNSNNELATWYHKELRSYTWGSAVTNPELTWIGYDIPNIRYDFEDLLEESLLQSCAWRAVVANAWAFGQECFIDEIAAELKRDPYEYRMSLLKEGRDAGVGHQYPVSNTRLRNVLKLAAERSGWPHKSGNGKGFGIAAYPYMHGNSYCAMVAEVSVAGGKIKVEKITCAVDCGLVINPSSVKSQMEGGVVWALSALLHGGIDIQQGRVVNSNFHQNRIVKMSECPVVEVFFAGTVSSAPNGVGELAPPVAIPAIVNAIYAATGKRIRKLPLSAADLV